MKTWLRIVPSVFLYILSIFCCTTSASLSYALFDSLYGMPIPDVERTSASFCLLHWSQYCDMPSIKGVSTVDWKPGASTDFGMYNAWLSDMWVCMICRYMNDADRCRACMRASVFTVCTAFGIHNVTLWSSCGTTVSPASSSDHLKTHGSCADCHCWLSLLVTVSYCASTEY